MAASQQQIQDRIGYATSLCLVTGLWQVVLSVLKFGKLSWLMSEIVLSAFVTAAAFHILTSQLKSLFGIIIQRSPKLFGIVYVSFHFYSLFQIRFFDQIINLLKSDLYHSTLLNSSNISRLCFDDVRHTLSWLMSFQAPML